MPTELRHKQCALSTIGDPVEVPEDKDEEDKEEVRPLHPAIR